VHGGADTVLIHNGRGHEVVAVLAHMLRIAEAGGALCCTLGCLLAHRYS
jgi:hypothetical protein